MDTHLANFNSGHGLGSLIQYSYIGANIAFVSSAVITSFASMLADPYEHFHDHPYWMFTSFCCFLVSTFNVTVTGPISSHFRNVADSVPEPGHEDKRILNMKIAFYISTIAGALFAIATAFLAVIWGRAVPDNFPFVVPCAFGILAVILDVAALLDNFKRFREETRSVELE